MVKFLKAPLLWFLLLGGLLFLLDGLRQKNTEQNIFVTQGDVDRIRDQWQAQSSKIISEEVLNNLLKQHVEEQRLYKEALSLGLDREDVIIRRRLVQKLRFLTEDLLVNQQPTDDELERYFLDNKNNYQQPVRVSFHHIYFSSELRQQNIHSDAMKSLLELRQSESDDGWKNLGDPFMLGRVFQHRTQVELEQQFGLSFVEDLLALNSRKWSNPIESSFGLHLVKVNQIQQANVLSLIEVRQQVLDDYERAQRKVAYKKYLESLAKKYPLVMEDNQTTSLEDEK